MQNRLRLVMGATVLLYMGPLLAGLSGMGWSAVPVFIALFALWLVVMRPAQWPRDLAKWSAGTAVAAAAQLAVNALIVIVLFGVGRGVGGVAGFLPQIPPLVPVALSFLSIPLSKLVWKPIVSPEFDDGPDDALRQAQTAPSHGPGATQPRDVMVETLLSLPADSDAMLTADAVDAALQGPKANARLAELEAALDRQTPETRMLRQAVVLWATDPARSPADGLHSAQASAFAIAGADPELLHLFAQRAIPLLLAQPGLWHAFPEAVDVAMTIDSAHPADLRDALVALADALENATPPEDRTSATP